MTSRPSSALNDMFGIEGKLDVPPPANPPAIMLTATRFLSPLLSSPFFPL
ncbi:hypothetical protein A2U01_0075334, partial [Trifolium medium]|nr:hypothetical protein [Trifolium medium]